MSYGQVLFVFALYFMQYCMTEWFRNRFGTAALCCQFCLIVVFVIGLQRDVINKVEVLTAFECCKCRTKENVHE